MTITFASSSPLEFYFAYLEKICPTIVYQEFERAIAKSVADSHWDDPKTALELNNFATIALIEAENADDENERELLLNLAIEALHQGLEDDGHPLCAAHLALVFYLTGERKVADEIAYETLAKTFQSAYYHASGESTEPIGMVYLPPMFDRAASESTLVEMFRCNSAHEQALIFLSKALVFAQPMMCSSEGLRWLELSASLLPDTPHTNLMLGLSHLHHGRAEGLLYLHRAQRADPAAPKILQALSLAYHDRGHLKNAEIWKTVACACQFPELTTAPEWRWTEVDIDSSHTYVAYEDYTLTIESRLSSTSTSMLLAQGDWPEREIEFWRIWLKPEAVAIDIGANIGQYTVSAAGRVGPNGRVLAIESDPACIACLKETKAINRLDCVTVYAAIAGDRNESPDWFASAADDAFGDDISKDLATPDAPRSSSHPAIEHLTLDALMFREELPRVDFIRVAPDRCTLELLAGSSQLIAIFQPTILFATPADAAESSRTFANALRAIGYKLFHYKPYVKQLAEFESVDALIEASADGVNAIAIHASQKDSVMAMGYSDANLADDAALAELLLASDTKPNPKR